MSNIIGADLYRLRKGAAMRNTILGIFALVLFVGITFAWMRSGAFQNMMEASLQSASMAEYDVASMRADIDEMNSSMSALPDSSASFAALVLGENFLTLFLLPIVIAVMGADFSSGAFRNTLSYETDRKKIYIGRYLVSIICTLVTLAASLLFMWLLGGILFGFGGFSGAYFARILTTLGLQLPIYLALLAFAQCLVAATQKSSTAIAVFLIVFVTYSGVIQLLAMLLPTVKWLMQLDFLSVVKMAGSYQSFSASDFVLPMLTAAVVWLASMVLGLVRYSKADMH